MKRFVELDYFDVPQLVYEPIDDDGWVRAFDRTGRLRAARVVDENYVVLHVLDTEHLWCTTLWDVWDLSGLGD